MRFMCILLPFSLVNIASLLGDSAPFTQELYFKFLHFYPEDSEALISLSDSFCV